jgi:hypothetical protein
LRELGSTGVIAGLYPFVVGDLYKVALAALALPTWRISGRRSEPPH